MMSCEEIIQLILPLLESRPAAKDVDDRESKTSQVVREDSWMTLDEIRQSLQESFALDVPAEEIEEGRDVKRRVLVGAGKSRRPGRWRRVGVTRRCG